jgi:hypothetical protein
MIALADVISRHEAAYLQQYRHVMLPSQGQAPGRHEILPHGLGAEDAGELYRL